MAALRESALLPTVKCSSCGLQVEISLIGDHMCSGPTAELSPPPEHDGMFHDGPFGRPYEKHGRVPAPVDTGAANRAYMHQGQLSPASQPALSRSVSPMTPGTRKPFRQPGDYSTSGGDKAEGLPRATPPFLRRPGDFAGQGPNGAPRSPANTKPIGRALMDRMNGMAPGPFDTSRRPSAVGEIQFPPRKDSLTKWDGPGPTNESTREKNLFGSSYQAPGPTGNLSTPKQPTRSGYEGFGPPPTPRSAGFTMESLDRLEVNPMLAALPESMRRPSQATLLPPMSIPSGRRPSLSPDTSRRPPPRTSLIPHDMSVDSVDLAAEFGSSNPYHAPSESSSSGFSTFSAKSHTSSQSSLSNSSLGEDGREHSPNSKMGHLHAFTEKLRPTDLHIDPNATARSPSFPPSPYAISPGIMRPGSAMRKSPGPEGYRPYVPTPSPRHDALPTDDVPPGWTMSPPQRKVTPEPGVASSRGECKACRQAITGKSISSADGRLTGKYHKACFVCTTCSEPFSSTEFYVLDDRPYCEQHYHRLNGSLCGGCGRGIEGQYVEDESRVKHHVDCFCCIDCGVSLSSSYFEVDGKAYCERDALRRTQTSPQPFLHNPNNSMSYGQRPYSPGPRSYGTPPGPPRSPGRMPPGHGPSGMGHPGMHRGPPSGAYSPGHLGSGMKQGPRPTMNKRMTRFGVM